MSADGKYQTITSISEGLYKEKGSKFIGLAYPLSHDSELKQIIEHLRKQHVGACHFCYAFRIGANGEQYRANDDGEPGGTAGKPILNQLLSFNLTNILLIVVRYYGGTKLGVSGLITAYKEAAIEALKVATIEERTVCDWFSVECDYDQLGEVSRILKEQGAEPVNKKFDERCYFLVGLPINKSVSFPGLFSLLKEVKVELTKRA